MAPNLTALRNVLSESRRASADGDATTARSLLGKALQALAGGSGISDLGQDLVWTGLLCGETEAACRILGQVFGGGVAFALSIQHHTSPPRPQQLLGCTFTSQGIAFEISRPAMSSPCLRQFVTRFLRTLPILIKCWSRSPPPEGSVMLDLADAARFSGVGYCANTDRIGLIPDPDFMHSLGYAAIRQHLRDHHVAWRDRRPMAVWRGATTGHGEGRAQSWLSLPRVKLCQSVQGAHADLFDVGISRIQLHPDDPGQQGIHALGLMRPYIAAKDFQTYRYQIDIDGYTNAWSGLFRKLLTGSPVLKIQSRGNFRQWYYDRLEPWTNFVPVSADMSDLVEKTRWLMEHDLDAQRIGKAGRALAESLTYESQLAAGANTVSQYMA